MPRVAVDATSLTARPTGAGRALRSLLATLPGVDSGTSYIALVTAEGAPALESIATSVELRVVSPGRNIGWELAGATRAAHQNGADVLFTVRELVGKRSPPTVLHVFEPPSYRLRAGLSAGARGSKRVAKDALLASLFGRSLRRAAAVTAGSATTAEWLRAHHRIEATVVLPGIEDAFFEATADNPRSAEGYVFHLASGDARDQTDAILAALALLGSAAPRLLVAGLDEHGRAELVRNADALGIGSHVEALGWVSDAELRELYRGALAYVHPSRYESYGGFAALEAMALGTPVVAFRAPGVTEALDGAALLLDAPDAGALAQGLRELIGDPELQARLAQAGRRRVEPLRWERAATELAGVFRRVLQ